eukprot:c835_g2_i1 orf=29-259(+)
MIYTHILKVKTDYLLKEHSYVCIYMLICAKDLRICANMYEIWIGVRGMPHKHDVCMHYAYPDLCQKHRHDTCVHVC